MATGVSTLSGPVRSSLSGPTRPVSRPFRRFQNFNVGASLPSKSKPETWLMEANKVKNERLAHSVRENLANGRVQFVQKSRGAFDDGSGYSRTGSHQFGNFPNGSWPNARYAITEITEDVITETVEDVLQPNMGQQEARFGENMRGNVGVERAMNDSKPVDRGGQGKVTPSRAQTCTKKEMSPKEKLVQIYDKVLVVDNVVKAREVVLVITTKYKDLVYACDTEVAKIDVKQETPVGHGEVVCFSIYCGSQADFGSGKSCIWVDVLDGGRNVLMEFAPFFEDESIKKG